LSRAPHAPDTASHAATPGAARAAPHAAPLYIVPSLLGAVPPEDVLPARTLAIARELTHWIVETPKAARAFFGTLGMARPIAGLSIAPLAGHASDSEIDALLAPARDGHAMGLVSDAGAPGVADPGARVVAVAHRSGVRVVPLVGPSAVLLALMAAGLEGQRFAFHGYLPAAAGERATALRALEAESRRLRRTEIFIETPYRNAAMLATLAATLAPHTRVCVACDLTLPSESIVTQSAQAWRDADGSAWQKRPAIFLLQA
jgi:16S rRNA (cytidine1402-2'-O)-methyltransferase